MKYAIPFSLISLFLACSSIEQPGPVVENNLVYTELATTWDEGIPLGNGELGALIWNKEGNLRMSLDRSDLWDLRPISWLEKDEFRFSWVHEKWLENDYGIVQEFFDKGAYSNSIAPSKIPGAGLEFHFKDVAAIVKQELDLATAMVMTEWKSGLLMESFVDANEARGYFKFSHLPDDFSIELTPPRYESDTDSGLVDEVTGQDLRRLGYTQGAVLAGEQEISYHQEGWGGFYYDVVVNWKKTGNELIGCWSITSSLSDDKGQVGAETISTDLNYQQAKKRHIGWWRDFWAKSDLQVPDPLLQKQWYLEQYKFGSAARAHTPPISLQAVWTADNGKMPPWKGDFHHDLNTQLSYWPAYSGNHLDLEIGFLNWLWEVKPVAERYTRDYFGVEGLNVPGVSTLEGKPMGGWIQYSCGPTVSAWLGQHFYLHWRYSMDKEFLADRAYPWMAGVATFLDNFSEIDEESGLRKLPLSSSPEIHNNSREAWFDQTTNFDLALIRFAFDKAAEMATELELHNDADHWRSVLSQWPFYAIDESGLNFAPGHPYASSHRHFSHLVGWHPLGNLDVSQGPEVAETIDQTLRNLEKYGPDWWTGYSYSWAGNLYARAFDGNRAAQSLRDFAQAFCLPNSFHVNGDQTKSGLSKFTYRPFTLEGNFAFASGLQEMLIQSHTGVVRLFPSLPDDWDEVTFDGLRTEGGFMVSAGIYPDQLEVNVEASVDGILKIALGASGRPVEREMTAGEKVTFYLNDFSSSGMVK